jgi:hypothetical protein
MAKADKKQKAFSWFFGDNRVRNIRIPEFDVEFMSAAKLDAIANAPRKTEPEHAKWLGEYADTRILIERKEGDEHAAAVYSFDEEASKLLMAAGAKLVRLTSFPITGQMVSAQDERLDTVMRLRAEFKIPCRTVSREASETTQVHAGKRKTRKQKQQHQNQAKKLAQEKALLAHFEARGSRPRA